MKAQTDVIQHTTNFGGEEIAMTVDANSLSHIMGVLTKIYADPVKAVIREIISNARDSHTAAGQTKPIVVTVPCVLDKSFTVQDFGVGLDLDDLRRVFSKYGASTKRDSNDGIGLFGIGAKSPLAYTSQFTLTCVKNGIKMLAMVTRDASGGGGIQIVDTSSTVEVNGVTVSVPVHTDLYTFREEIRNFLRFWDTSEYVLIGETSRTRPAPEIAEGNFAVWNDRAEPNVLLMGGVAYPLGGKPLGEHLSLTLYANIGDVDVTPSREELMSTAKTRAYLEGSFEHAKKRVAEIVSARIDAEPNHVAAREAAKRNARVLSCSPSALTYRGEPIQITIEQPVGKFSVGALGIEEAAQYVDVSASGPSYIKHKYVYNFPRKRMSKRDKAIFVELYPKETIFVYKSDNPLDPWFTDYGEAVDWDTIKDTKVNLPSSVVQKQAKATTHMRVGGFTLYGDKLQKKTIDTETPVYVEVGGRHDSKYSIDQHERVNVYRVYNHQLHAFHNRYPNAIPYEKFQTKRCDEYLQKQGLETLARWNIKDHLGHENLDAASLLDPELRAILATERPLGVPTGWGSSSAQQKVYNRTVEIKDKLDVKYPLFMGTSAKYGYAYGARVKTALYDYVNQIYKETK